MMDSQTIPNVMQLAIASLLWILALAIKAGGVGFLIYYCLTLPMRRAERARLFLDLLETALRQGRPVEEMIVSVVASGDPLFSSRFQSLAAALQGGCRLSVALGLVPRLLPPQVVAMLRAGEQIGDLTKVLPACRQLLKDPLSQVTHAKNFLAGLPLVAAPLTGTVLLMFMIFVVPKYSMVAADLGATMPAWSEFIFGLRGTPIFLMFLMALLLWLPLVGYLGGPRFRAWLQEGVFPFADDLMWWLPWKRLRMQRDFSAMLSVLLDAGMPEPEAVTLAARCTANQTFERRADQARQDLARGMKLTEAVARLDDHGGFKWRMATAGRAYGGFRRALAGWHEALDAKAFQIEQAAAHLFTTTMVVLNGLIVGAFVIAVFLLLVSVLDGALLW